MAPAMTTTMKRTRKSDTLTAVPVADDDDDNNDNLYEAGEGGGGDEPAR